ncbi:AAA+-type ATPase [Xylographa opegraphella]|nr:AAA+-type ATPase [Xylographa opegraphella]
MLRLSEETENVDGMYIHVIAWAAPERIQDTVVQTSKALQELHHLKLGDKVSIKSTQDPLLDILTITMSEIPQVTLDPLLTSLDKVERGHWAWYLELPLIKAEVLCPGMIIVEVELKGQKRSFKVDRINHNDSSDTLYRFVSASAIVLQDPDSSRANSTAGLQRSLVITQDGIGGLTRQLDQLNQRLSAYNNSLQRLKLPPYYRSRRGGVLLYGPPGTGKSLILKKVSDAGWAKVFHLDGPAIGQYGGNVDTAVSRIFADARRRQPSVVIIDRLETLAGKIRDPSSTRIINITTSLCEEFERLGDSGVLVIAATEALSDVDEALRRPGCFEFQLELPIPDSKTRTEILKILTSLHPDSNIPMLQNVGDRTHGFVGSDLDKLIQLAVDKATARTLASNVHTIPQNTGNDHSSWPSQDDQRTLYETPELVVDVTEVDLNNALLEVRPTAMQEVFLETPKVRWTDIGGQHEIKRSLKQAVEWPFKYPDEMARLGIEPKKGLLLYGPPGCSKTLTAAAVATEAGLNFLAVKGAELLSMYVGESERAVREVFRKARAAAPSIIFFDEIDAIGASREGPGQHGGLNVLTTLLNELDGIEVLKGVFVLAATNKPEVLDPALMRPGRLDTMLYVGPPDQEARKEILNIRVGKMDVAVDVDIEFLAAQTDGYSGAEIVSVCQRAGYAALEEQESSGEMMQVWKRHFDVGLREVQRQITPEMRARYEGFGKRGAA